MLVLEAYGKIVEFDRNRNVYEIDHATMMNMQDFKKPPAAATIFFGANDAAILGRTSERQHVPVEEYKENLRKIVLHMKVQHVPFAHLSSLPLSSVL